MHTAHRTPHTVTILTAPNYKFQFPFFLHVIFIIVCRYNKNRHSHTHCIYIQKDFTRGQKFIEMFRLKRTNVSLFLPYTYRDQKKNNLLRDNVRTFRRIYMKYYAQIGSTNNIKEEKRETQNHKIKLRNPYKSYLN